MTDNNSHQSLDAPNSFGCEHYRRKSKFVTPCCQKIYTCRFCHDEKENHAINRKEINQLICALCNEKQSVDMKCRNCGIRFGQYACLECRLFDDEDKKQFHCQGCGLCRIGGSEKFFHCTKCNMCLPVHIQNGHKCVENVSRADCPVCLEDIHTSRIPCHVPPCGHLIHRTCYDQLILAGLIACPTCQASLPDMKELWQQMDEVIARNPIPTEYASYVMEILCKDCQQKGVVKFHPIGAKCRNCGSYSNCSLKGPYKQTNVEGI